MDVDACPHDPEEVAEALIMDRLDAESAEAFALHCVACPACAGLLSKNDAFINGIRNAGIDFEVEDIRVSSSRAKVRSNSRPTRGLMARS